LAELELMDDVWTPPRANLAPGDVCIAPHPALAGDPALLLMPVVHDGFALTVTVAYALVIDTYSSSVSYIPVTTGELFHDPTRLVQLVERARSAAALLRLPPLRGAWEEPVVAFLRMPQTVSAGLLTDKRVASMRDDARGVLRRRFLRAYTRDS
jgi:hypothetical protein